MKYSQYLRKVRKVLAGHNVKMGASDTLFLCRINDRVVELTRASKHWQRLCDSIQEACKGANLITSGLRVHPEWVGVCRQHVAKFDFTHSRKTIRMSWITHQIRLADAEEKAQ